ncbi:DUF3341 domain-containing protein [Blattabacterium punctulatus]|uniref:DUF3341 domain-containing protein n=1 Tax=Blattabacterium punctulatus TaxID=164514 RepID=A0ABM6WN73_9FLAO|nr:DUF3341 domain-containing protein [Blattabacterium punctulatus]AWU40053.1 DUF3341 domain-containing protein [Blattabacterium punctulatus]AWU40595.1 DUF3341 domain-containing protein [Blattabacterium punctulatus]
MNQSEFNIHALYDNDDLMINSIKILIKKKITIYEVYTPFPVHNLDKLLELKKTNLSFLSFLYGFFGFFLASILTWYTMIYDWPQNIGGKPSFSWFRNLPSFIPVIFEFSIFFSAHFMCITYLIQCKLFPGSYPKNPDPRTTDNMFLIEINTKNNVEKLLNLLKKNGAMEVNVKKIV